MTIPINGTMYEAVKKRIRNKIRTLEQTPDEI